MVDITIFLAFSAGLLSFLSPCILPLVPAFVAYLSGVSVQEAKMHRRSIFVNSLFFVLGFSIVFALLGVLLTTVLGTIAYDARIWLSRIGGVIIIGFALYLLGILKLPFLEREHKLKAKKFRSSYLTSFVFGFAFATGWTPCVGAILGGILTLALTLPINAFYLLLSYALGLGIPFLIAGLFTDRIQGFVSRSAKFLKYFNIIAGIFLLIIGILVLTNLLPIVSSFFLPAIILQ